MGRSDGVTFGFAWNLADRRFGFGSTLSAIVASTVQFRRSSANLHAIVKENLPQQNSVALLSSMTQRNLVRWTNPSQPIHDMRASPLPGGSGCGKFLPGPNEQTTATVTHPAAFPQCQKQQLKSQRLNDQQAPRCRSVQPASPADPQADPARRQGWPALPNKPQIALPPWQRWYPCLPPTR